jgi:hypothetical protein
MFETENESNEGVIEQEVASPADKDSGDEGGQPPKEVSKEDNLPFHEHPRWKELMDQRKADQDRIKQYERQLEQINQRLAQPAKTAQQKDDKAELFERLKGIDPAFGKLMEELYGKASKIEEVDSWRQQTTAETVREKALNTINQFHTEQKVPQEWQQVLNAQIEAEIRMDPSIGLHNLKEVCTRVHGNFSKLMDSVKRSERESYVKGKREDNAPPGSQPKGQPAKPGKQAQDWSKNPQERRAQLESKILEQIRADRKANT